MRGLIRLSVIVPLVVAGFGLGHIVAHCWLFYCSYLNTVSARKLINKHGAARFVLAQNLIDEAQTIIEEN